jgi:23S rRNA (pseudouridine1915-N3)-methyltransferase
MKLRVVALGHRMPGWVTAGWDDYARRMPRAFALELVEVKPEPRDRGKPLPQLLASEAVRIAAACMNARVIALDEHGESWTTRMLAETLSRWRDEARDAALVIGSADGLADAVKRNAAAVVALSALTLPHGLVRVVVAEQLYRATSLLAGHPYHRE